MEASQRDSQPASRDIHSGIIIGDSDLYDSVGTYEMATASVTDFASVTRSEKSSYSFCLPRRYELEARPRSPQKLRRTRRNANPYPLPAIHSVGRTYKTIPLICSSKNSCSLSTSNHGDQRRNGQQAGVRHTTGPLYTSHAAKWHMLYVTCKPTILTFLPRTYQSTDAAVPRTNAHSSSVAGSIY